MTEDEELPCGCKGLCMCWAKNIPDAEPIVPPFEPDGRTPVHG